MFRNSSADGTYYAMYDANYNVTGIELSSTVQERFTYNAYGKRTELNASWSPSADSKKWVIGFQGMRWDKETGLFYQRNRWYDPELMRWSSWDPIGYGDGMNPMAFVRGNPINYVDFTGKDRYFQSPHPLKGQTHSQIAVDTWNWDGTKYVKTGVVTLSFAWANSFSGWAGFFLIIVPAEGEVRETPGYALHGDVLTLPSQPWEDMVLLNAAKMQMGGASPPYSLVGNSCWQWSVMMIEVGYGEPDPHAGGK
jgi:RHS repeat-associated protein